MKYQTRKVKHLTDLQLLAQLHLGAKIYSKVSVLNQLLDLKNSKCYKIGEKDLVTKNNDFEMAIGNSSGVVGYDHRISLKGTNIVDKTKLPMPTTLITTPITQLVSKPEKIIFILQRNLDEEKYGKIFFEIKKDLLQEEYYLLPEQIRQHINPINRI